MGCANCTKCGHNLLWKAAKCIKFNVVIFQPCLGRYKLYKCGHIRSNSFAKISINLYGQVQLYKRGHLSFWGGATYTNIAIFHQSIKERGKLYKYGHLLLICYRKVQTVWMWPYSINLLKAGTNCSNVILFYQSVMGRGKLYKCGQLLLICYRKVQMVLMWSYSINLL